MNIFEPTNGLFNFLRLRPLVNPQVSTTFTAAAYAANALCGLVAVLPQAFVEYVEVCFLS